ncbi:hypothetical protein [Streptomyces sp. PA5.6]|uniref:hypothetical protein n=1 Tax=Streptomyces sp. PA5.6 TaxID=3035651 RepID=UPI00390498A9
MRGEVAEIPLIYFPVPVWGVLSRIREVSITRHTTSNWGNKRMRNLKTAAIGLAAMATLAAVSVPAAASTSSTPETQAADPAYRILKHLDYYGPGKASLRVGYYQLMVDRGFGWNKIKKKHNITKYGAVEYIAKSPKRENIGGQSYRSTGYAGKYRCRNGICHLVSQKKMLLTINDKKLRDGQDKGVINMYCKGVVVCPNWVSKALAKANNRMAPEEEGVIPEAEAPVNEVPPADGFEPEDGSPATGEDDIVEGSVPADEDAEDGSESYVRSYEPLGDTLSFAQMQAADSLMTVGS